MKERKTDNIEFDLSNVEVYCVGEIDANEYIRKKVIESMKREENSYLYKTMNRR